MYLPEQHTYLLLLVSESWFLSSKPPIPPSLSMCVVYIMLTQPCKRACDPGLIDQYKLPTELQWQGQEWTQDPSWWSKSHSRTSADIEREAIKSIECKCGTAHWHICYHTKWGCLKMRPPKEKKKQRWEKKILGNATVVPCHSLNHICPLW